MWLPWERRQVVLFFVRPESSSWSRTQETELNQMAEAKQYANLQIFKAHKSFVVFNISPPRNMQLILLCNINFAEVNVQIFADTSSQSIQMVSQIFLSFLFIFLFIFFFGYFLGWSIGGVCGPARKVVHGPGVSVFGSPLHELSVDTAPTGAGHVLTSCV